MHLRLVVPTGSGHLTCQVSGQDEGQSSEKSWEKGLGQVHPWVQGMLEDPSLQVESALETDLDDLGTSHYESFVFLSF